MTEVTFNSPMQKMQYEGLVEFINEHNTLVGKVNAATGDKEALFDSIASQEEFADLNAKIAELQEQLEAAVNVKVEEALNSDQGDVTEATEKAKELKSTIGSGLNYYKKLYGEAAAEAFPKIERLKGVRTGGGSGGRRIRGFNVIVTDAAGVNEYDNFATAAKALGVDTKELQDYFFAKAGVEKIADAPDEVVFVLKWTDTAEDGTTTDAQAEVKAYRTAPSEDEAEAPTEVADEAAEEEADAEVPDEDELVNFN